MQLEYFNCNKLSLYTSCWIKFISCYSGTSEKFGVLVQMMHQGGEATACDQ